MDVRSHCVPNIMCKVKESQLDAVGNHGLMSPCGESYASHSVGESTREVFPPSGWEPTYSLTEDIFTRSVSHRAAQGEAEERKKLALHCRTRDPSQKLSCFERVTWFVEGPRGSGMAILGCCMLKCLFCSSCGILWRNMLNLR